MLGILLTLLIVLFVFGLAASLAQGTLAIAPGGLIGLVLVALLLFWLLR